MRHFILVESRSVYEHNLHFVRELGLSPVYFSRIRDIKPEVYRNIDTATFDRSYDVDTNDVDAMLALIESASLDPAGVLGCEDDVMVPAALLAQRLGLPHPALDGLRNVFHKDTTRDILARAGIEQPRYTVIDLADIPAQPPLAFPFVFKPVRDAGALGVHFCRDQADYERALEAVGRYRMSCTGLPRTRFLLEEFIEGDFYGAEMLWHHGAWQIMGINRIFIGDKNLCMIGISHPSDLAPLVLAEVEREILRWVTLLGLRGSAINVEFMMVGGRPVLIEFNPRIAGAHVYKQLEMTAGIEPVKHMVRYACGLEDAELVERPPTAAHVAEAFVFAPRPGEIRGVDISRLDTGPLILCNFREMPFVLSDAAPNFESMLGYVLVSGPDCMAAMDNATRIADQVQLVYG